MTLRFRQKFTRTAAAIAASLVACGIASGDGPGFPNLSYPGKSPMEVLSVIDATVGAPRGHGFVTLHRGYLLVVCSDDGGGGNGSGGFSFLDISDPENPVNAFTTYGNPIYTNPGSPNYAGNIREAHAFTFSGDLFCTGVNGPDYSGLQFWDMSNPLAPARLSEIALSSLIGGNYEDTVWWLSWQGGRYVYAASTLSGLHIVDASDPSNPVELSRIPIGSLGGAAIHMAFPIGNLLVLARANGGIVTTDISDPANPVVLDFDLLPSRVGYSGMVNGNKVFGARNPAIVHDISDPANIVLEGVGPAAGDIGGYGTFKDGQFYYGASTEFIRLDVSSLPYTIVNTASPTGFVNPDWDFGNAIGNLVFVGNDHAGSVLLVGDTTPDTLGPEVNMVNPADGAVNMATTSRVGITLTDQANTATIDANTFIVRPVGGTALPGRYSNQTGMVNFWPDNPLATDTTYEVVIPAGGIEDFAGNGVATTFVSQFSTGSTINLLAVNASSPGPAETGATVSFSAVSVNADAPEFSWDFGDGTAPTPYNSDPAANHTYSSPGNYSVIVRIRDGESAASSVFGQLIHRPLTAGPPAASSTIVFDTANNRVWNTNPDNDTVTAINATTLVKDLEVPAGTHPRTIALGPSNELWVTAQDSDSLVRLDRASGALLGTVDFDYGSAPYGVAFAPDHSVAYVTLKGSGQLVRIDPLTRAITGTIALGSEPAGIAVTADGSRILVTRFLSPDSQGEILDIDAAAWSVSGTIGLQIDPGPDTEETGRGLPNYLTTIAISPDGAGAWIPSKKDNIQRGLVRDGIALTFENTIRSIVSKIDLATGTEDVAARVDFNDRDFASAVAFSKFGNYVFVATQGSNSVEIVDAYSNRHFGAVQTNGLAPQGVAVSADGTTLFVHNFMSRTVTVFRIANLCAGVCGVSPQLAEVSTVASEALPAQILFGKQVFYNAADPRMSLDSYISCASCHLDGKHDGRTWDFTDRGEGLRNTTALDGRAGTGHGRVHWSANFDEIQDFEHDMRGPFGGTGFMDDGDFHSGNRDRSLGGAKSGFSPELDALTAYVSSLATVPRSPYRDPAGALTPSAAQGEILFGQRCATCHSGPDFTDSVYGTLHDVGTLTADSGNRLGQTLPGIDTPGLRGAWASSPYLHDGSAATLMDVLTTRNPSDLHGVTSDLDAAQLQNLADYLLQLDDNSTPFPVVAPPPNPDFDADGMPNTYEDENGFDPYANDAGGDADDDQLSNGEEFTYGTNPHDPDSDNDGYTDGEEVAAGSNPLNDASSPLHPPPYSLGNFATIDAPNRDSWLSNLVVNETDTYTNLSGFPELIQIDTFNFYARSPGNPLTPFVVRVNGTGDFTVIAVGTTRTALEYAIGANSLPFASGPPLAVTVAEGETIAVGFTDADADGNGGGAGAVIPYVDGVDEIWYTGGPGAGDSGRVATGSPPVPGSSTFTQLTRSYRFNLELTNLGAYVPALPPPYNLGNSATNGPSADSWVSNMIVNESAAYTNSSGFSESIRVDHFNFYAIAKANPLTPFVARVNGDNDFTILAVGSTRLNTDYVAGTNSFPFSDGPAPVITLAQGETIAVGFTDAFANGSGGGAGAVIPFSNGADEVWFSGGPNPGDSGCIAVGFAPTKGPSTFTHLNRAYHFNLDFSNLGPAMPGPSPLLMLGNNAMIDGSNLDAWLSNMVINESDSYTNTTGSPELIQVDTFSFYARAQANPLTPFVVRINGDNDFTVLAVGTTRNPIDYNLGPNSLPFSTGAPPVVTLEDGETLAVGFTDAAADGSGGGAGAVIPFTIGGDEIWYSGGPGAADSGSVIAGAAPTPGSTTFIHLNRIYNFNLHFSNLGSPDSDSDGIPDSFEVAHGMDPMLADAHLDADNDSDPNLVEYLTGSLPDDPNSRARLDCFLAIHPGVSPSELFMTLEITVNDAAAAGLHFEPQVCADLYGWSADPTDVEMMSVEPNGDGTTTIIYRDRTAMSISLHRYIRLVVASSK